MCLVRSAIASDTEGPPVPWHLVRGAPDADTRLRATVVGADGSPVASAEVVIDTVLGVHRARTGPDGRCDVALPTSSPVARVVVVAPGHGMVVTNWRATPAASVTDLGVLRMPAAAVIRGRVEDADGHPVRWAWVGIDASRTFGPAWETIARITDAARVDCDADTGEFRIDTLPAGGVVLSGGAVTHDVAGVEVRAPADRVALRGTPWPDGPRFDFDLRLVPPDELWPDERVVAETPTAFVELATVPGRYDEGTRRVPLVPPVVLRFLPSQEHEPATLRLDRVPRVPVEFHVRARRNTARGGGLSLRGVVTLDGVPVTWSDADGAATGHRFMVEVTCDPAGRRALHGDGPDPVADTLTAPDGSFAFDGLVAGRYRARVTGTIAIPHRGDLAEREDPFGGGPDARNTSLGDPWDTPVPDGWATAARDGTVRVAVRRRESRHLRIGVPDAIRDAPDFRLECVAVAASRRAFPGGPAGPLPYSVRDDAAASVAGAGGSRDVIVSLRGARPGEGVDVAVRARAHGVWSRRVVLRSADAATTVLARIATGAPIRGRAIAGGAPVAGALVEIRNPADYGRGDFAVTGPDGRFEVAGFDASVDWQVTARESGPVGRTGSATAVTGSREVSIEMHSPVR